MAGFAAGLAQGFGNFGDDLAADRVRREESQIRQLTFLRQQQLDQAKQVGDLIKSYSDAIETLPEDQVGVRTDLFKQQIEAATGTKIDPAVWKTMKSDPKGTAEAMTQMYVDKPFTPKALGGVLGNINAFTGLYDALQRRNQSVQAAADFGMGTGGAATGGTPAAGQPGAAGPGAMSPLEAIDAQIAQIGQSAQRLSATGQLDKQRTSFLEKRLSILQQQRDQLLTGNTEQQKQDQQPLPLPMLQQLGLPAGTTYGDLRRQNGSGAQTSPVAPQPAMQAAPVAARGAGGFSAVPAKGSTPPAILDNLRSTESSGNVFAINKDTKAMGPYQFMPETLAAMTKAGISFNPFDEPQARDAADRYITMLTAQNGGDIRKALAQYGGFVTKDPSAYVNKVMKGVSDQPVAQPASRSLVPPTEAEQKQSVAQAEQLQKDFSGMQQAGVKAGKRARDLEGFMSVLEKSGETGTFAKSKLAFQKIAKGIGFDLPDSSSYAEAAKGMAVPLYLALRDTSEGGGLPGQMVTYEEQLLQSAFPGLEKLDGANKIMANIMIQNDKRTEAVAKELRDYVRGTKSFDGSPKKAGFVDSGIFDVAQKYKEEHPIISPENVKKLQEAAGGSVVRKKTPTAPDNRPPLNSFFK